MRLGWLLGLWMFVPAMVAQSTQAPTAFAVATIKPSAPDAETMTQIRGNRFVSQGTTFVDLFKYAYNVHPGQVVGGPEWLRTEKFDVNADPETEKRPSSDEFKAMMQKLLVERFHVVMHKEQKVMPVYALVKAPGGPKLTPTKAEAPGIPAVGYDLRGSLEGSNATMVNLAGFLQRFVLDRPAVDQTRISGRFDFALTWTPDDAPSNAALPGLFTAIQEQLGLKLLPVKAAVEAYVVDGVEKPAVD